MRVVVIGGGVLGTMHAWMACQRGHEVVHLERQADSRGASVRNFGLIWVSGRAEGDELATALRARELWEAIAADAPGVGFVPRGSLTVLRTAAEWSVAEQAMNRDSARLRQLELVDADGARIVNPALSGQFLGALWCRRDASVEPRVAQTALRTTLARRGRYSWQPGCEARAVDVNGVRDDAGRRYPADVVIVCPGAARGGLVRELAGEVPVRPVRLQMMQTAPMATALTTAVADADSLRYYPAYRGSALDRLVRDEPQPQTAAAEGMQLLMVQRQDGSLTIGDTHAYTEPFDFDVREEPYEQLRRTAEAIVGQPLPPTRRRWSGVYSETVDRSLVVHRGEVQHGVWLVMGPGGRGMTCSPAIAESTSDAIGL